MRVFRIALCALAMFPMSQAFAEGAPDRKWAVRFGFVTPSSSSATLGEHPLFPGTSTILDWEKASDGAEATIEWYSTKRVGLEFGWTFYDFELRSDGNPIGVVAFNDISFNLNFHLARTRYVDFYFGPALVYQLAKDLEPGGLSSVPTENSLGVGINTAIDINFGGKWGAFFGLRYFQSDVTFKQRVSPGFPVSLPLDPLLFRIGALYRW